MDISNETVEVLSLNHGQYERDNVYGKEDEVFTILFDSFSLTDGVWMNHTASKISAFHVHRKN
nr:hypothetical protein [Salicibibacter kimchii]